MSWLPVLGFAALGLFFFQKAVRSRARRSWAWGRAGSGAPLSRRGYAVWGALFLCTAWIVSQAPEPPPWTLLVFSVLFVAMLRVGFADSAAHRAASAEHDSMR